MISPLPTPSLVAKCRILVVGDSMLDRYWYGDVVRISPEAPVPVVHIQSEEDRLGGAANVALNIRSLGAHVTLLTMVGQDVNARRLKELVCKKDIVPDFVEDLEMETIVKLRVIGRSQQMLRIDFEKEPAQVALTGMLERFTRLLKTHDVVVFSDYGKGGLKQISRMIIAARDAGKKVLIDPKGNDWKRYSGAYIITPNRAELTQVIGHWSNEDELYSKAELLRQKLGLRGLLVTRSEEGMTLFEAERVSSVPAHAREVADVTGAGDTVIATLSLMVACGLELEQAMAWANRAGGLVVAKFGTACLTYEELRG
jgi:rfaE bifunctional protein kinase chain/domain